MMSNTVSVGADPMEIDWNDVDGWILKNHPSIVGTMPVLAERAAAWEQTLRTVFPLDLPPTLAVYIASHHELWPDTPPTRVGMAYTGLTVDLQMRPALESRGTWRGRGFPVIFPSWYLAAKAIPAEELDSILLHEFAHHCEVVSRKLSAPDEPAIKTPQNTAASVAEARCQYDAEQRVLPCDGHGARFTRAAMHVWHRAAAAGFGGKLQDVHVAGPRFGMSSAETYAASLADEVRSRSRESIGSILDDHAPAEFQELWESDWRRICKGDFPREQ